MNRAVILSSALLLFLSLTPTCLHAALPEISYRTWTTADGLPDDRVQAIAQDGRGYLYIATYTGICRFDGHRFTPVVGAGLPTAGRARARVLCPDAEGTLWIGLHRMIVRLGGSRPEVYTQSQGLPDDTVASLCEDGEGGIFASFLDGGIFHIHDGKVTLLGGAGQPRGDTRGGVCRDETGRIWCCDEESLWEFQRGAFVRRAKVNRHGQLAPARGGGVWVLEYQRVRRFDPAHGYTTNVGIPKEKGQVTSLHEDAAGTVWIATRNGAQGGLFRLDGAEVVPVAISDPEASAVTSDREGNVWVGSFQRGLKRIQPRMIHVLRHGGATSEESIQSFGLDENADPWLALKNGRLLRRSGSDWETVRGFGGPDEPKANAIARHGTAVYVGTRAHGLFRLSGTEREAIPRTTHEAGSIIALMVDSTTAIWLSFSDGLIRRVRAAAVSEWRLPETNSRVLVAGPGGQTFIAATGGRLFVIRADEKLAEITLPVTGEYALRPVLADPDGTLWFGLGGGGLGRLNNGRFTRITTEDGLMDNYVSHVVKDRRGRLWVASNQGLSRLDLPECGAPDESLRIVRYPLEDEMRVGFGSHNKSVLDRQGRLWFAGQSGLLVVTPQAWQLRPPGVSPIIESIRLDGRPQPSPGPAVVLRLPPDHSRLQFTFTLPSFSSPENVEFRTWLDGFDSDWSPPGLARQAVYSRLPAGTYRFRVSARGVDGNWTEAAPVAVIVAPHFWQTIPFALCALGGMAGGAAWLTRWRMQRRLRRQQLELEREQQWSRERARIARDMHDDLGSSLVHLAMLSDLAAAPRLDEKERIRSMGTVAGMARDLAKHLQAVIWSINPEHDTMTSVTSYLCQHATDLLQVAGIHCFLDVPREASPAILPSTSRHHLLLAVREALNNIVRHAAATEVRLRVRNSDDVFIVELQDNGRGFDPARGRPGGNGLGNMEERMKLAGGHCHLESRPGCTRVVFEVPLALQPTMAHRE